MVVKLVVTQGYLWANVELFASCLIIRGGKEELIVFGMARLVEWVVEPLLVIVFIPIVLV